MLFNLSQELRKKQIQEPLFKRIAFPKAAKAGASYIHLSQYELHITKKNVALKKNGSQVYTCKLSHLFNKVSAFSPH